MDASAAEPEPTQAALEKQIEDGAEAHQTPDDVEESKRNPRSRMAKVLEKMTRRKASAVATAPAADKNDRDPFAHLPEHRAGVLRLQLDTTPVSVGPLMLFRYTSSRDLILMAVSAVCAIAGGAVMPLMTVVFGSLAGTFQGFFLGTVTGAQFEHELSRLILYFVYLAVVEFFTIYICTVGFIYTGERTTAKIREHYLAGILRQNVGYYDKIGAGEITTRITADTNTIQDGISEKVSLFLTALATFITAFVIGFVKGWLLTLILCSAIFTIVLVVSVASTKIVKWSKQTLTAYAEGGTVAEEVLSSIRNTAAFGTQDRLAKLYDNHLIKAQYYGTRFKCLLGFIWGAIMCIIYLTYALAFWEGSRLLVRNQAGIDLSAILTILLSIMIGSFSLGNVGPHVQAFTTAMAAAGKIYSVIDRKSPLDPTNDDGVKPEATHGDIELRNVSQIYPSRPEVQVMDNVSLTVPAGKTTALVGASGSGKSTIIGLIERFYEPVEGQVLLDGVDLRQINLRYLRQQISLVGQEPVLFGSTIFTNISHGLIGTSHEQASREKKMELVIEAAKKANAHSFISELPEGYDTSVGERGFLLSGGQKQRVAIARAIISNPKILLLDEATSALDTKSEGVVQAALDNASEGRTTVVVAHRLSTIKHADQIVVMSQGKIVETGRHDELLAKGGAYASLVAAQEIAAAQEPEVGDLADDEKIESESSSGHSQTSAAEEKIGRTATLELSRSGSRPAGPSTYESDGKYLLWRLIRTIASFNKEEWYFMLFGLTNAIIVGGGEPTQAILFAKCIVALARPPDEYDLLRRDIDFWAWMFFMLAFVILFAYTLEGLSFAFCSERMIRKARDGAFRTMLRQDVGWFDRDENTSGALTTFLSTETTHLAGLSGVTLGTLLHVSTTLIAAFAVSLAIGWKLALVCISTVPVIFGAGFVRFWMLARFQERSKKAYEKSASYACEATSAIRTVASLTREQDVWDNYHRQLVEQQRRSLISVMKSSALYAGGQAAQLMVTALGFWFGGTLIGRGEYSLQQFFICYSTVIFGAQSAGTIFSFAPDMGKAKQAAAELQKLFDRRPAIDSWDTKGVGVTDCNGNIDFKDVHFRYPTRQEQPILKGLNLSVKQGQYVALVGASGCGKSTTIALLERFYDPNKGRVELDGQDISTLNLTEYRRYFALVSQEPTLYQGTIRENILLGATDDMGDVSDEQLFRACKDANILSFIESLPEGFETVVGNKGVMLSGGQKQRVAIARALIRNPRVLLLDEATSALDSESEKVVQAALDQAAKGRTTIAIAHRLSTIQNADCIFVFEGGKVVESGTHAELIKKKAVYHELVALQSLEKTG